MDVQYQRGMLETEGVCLSQPITCSWSKVAILHDSIVVRTHPRAIPPAMITMGKSIHGFPFLSRMGMGLHVVALWAAGASLKGKFHLLVAMDRGKHGNGTGLAMKKIFPTPLCTNYC